MTIMPIVHSDITRILQIILIRSNDSLSIFIIIIFYIMIRITDFGERKDRNYELIKEGNHYYIAIIYS